MVKVEKLRGKRKKPGEQVKLILVGLTPGRVQHKAINESKRPREGAFKGQMRGRIFKWFKELGIVGYFGFKDEDDMFLNPEFDDLIYLTSLLRDPVYYENGKNYSGRNPLPWKDEKLMKLLKDTVDVLSNTPENCIIVPCGDIVAEGLKRYFPSKFHGQVLFGFPHPSPLNSHAQKKFDECKSRLLKQVETYLKKDTPFKKDFKI